MPLVTFGIDKDRNLIIQFPVVAQPNTQKPLVLYQLETVLIPILAQNIKAHSYTHLQFTKPYIALNSDTYISLRQQELSTCKRIGYEFYCKELFVVKHKTSYSCESAIYFNLDTDASTNLKDLIKGYAKNKEIFDLKQRHISTILNTSKNFFSNNYIVDTFVFASSIISIISTILIIYLLCKHKQIRTLITSLVLHQIKEVSASSTETNSDCKTLAYIGIILTILSLIIVKCLHYKKSKFCKGHKFSNAVKNFDVYFRCAKLCTN